ncbi:MAG: ABC-2 family transporter protein [Oscillospiraceae bacterium]|jgi:ABC-2 type transport system permease protein|nr:ABC-2 family transporter protein [Oscillospiraceae bacterium]
MKLFKRKIDTLIAVAFVTFKEWGAYRTHSMVSIFVGPVYFAAQYYIWTAVYGGSGELNGMKLAEMIRYFGASALIGYLVMDFAAWNLNMLVESGKFLTFALRPLNHRFFAFSQKAGHRLLGFVLEFIPCLILFALLFKVDMRPAYAGWLLLSVVLAFLMNFFVNYCLGMFSFWFVHSGGIRMVYGLFSSVFTGMLIPLVFFPKPLQVIQLFLPFQYTAYVPVMVFLGRYSLGGITLPIPAIVGIQAVAVMTVFVISEIMYRAAMKRFTAVGA